MSDKLKIVFAPGFLESFEGTQEELDEIIKDITQMMESANVADSNELLEMVDMLDGDPFNPVMSEEFLAEIDEDALEAFTPKYYPYSARTLH